MISTNQQSRKGRTVKTETQPFKTEQRFGEV
jgi:hypothetical protein